MSSEIKGPGLLWVTSRIAPSAVDILDERTYLIDWYDNTHIAEIIQTKGIKNAFRYTDVEKGTPDAPRPYLAFYPMLDLAFTQGPDFKHITVKSDCLPGSGICYDLADIDVSYLALVGKMEGNAKKGPAQYIMTSAIEPANRTSEEEVNKFYDEQTAAISKASNYLRTTRYRLVYARTNAQSRKLKGLPTTDEPAPEPPTWQAVHEFSAEPASDVRDRVKANPSEVLKKARQNELHVYKLEIAHGDKKFFE
ncbi:uncharacterized protein BDR25DRAFT_335268 [Lindgomyces ingoldianus]|uniref:Uncharacterized protein n=1 Tax=Lindgomyces ingoldianus TaxID=673940 RepID=A0ACB6QPX5_9PLEO|nr:uncharacterized protein BDR25DRAFT_335268 [Lindgomyces ingoldianus]KAF2468930.1 hypothetical protein BDR25DRAFT_335268 [Lindgomyces ingoldianus]